MISCGHCKSQHETVSEVRACATSQTPELGDFRSGGKSHPSIERHLPNPSTLKQRDFMLKLASEREVPVAGKTDAEALYIRLVEHLQGDSDYRISKSEASEAIGWLLKLPATGAKLDLNDNLKTDPDVPAGRYAIETSDGVKFYKVDCPTTGKWLGWTFLKMLVGAPGHFQEFAIKGSSKRVVLGEIESMGVRESAVLFGRKTRHCGRCMSPLTDPRSRAAGYGERCSEVMGWPYPSIKEALVALGESEEDEGDQLAFEAAARAEQRFEEHLETLGFDEAGIQDREEAARGVRQYSDWTV